MINNEGKGRGKVIVNSLGVHLAKSLEVTGRRAKIQAQVPWE
jgi:hypothetical protein